MTRTSEPADRQPSLVAWVPVAFGLLAAWFAFGPQRAPVPTVAAADISLKDLKHGPLRTPMTDPPKITVMGGFIKECKECHEKYEKPKDPSRTSLMHEEIRLEHGTGKECLDCHDPHDRNRLNIGGTRTVPFADVARMCGKCHGPTYRAWRVGIHGKAIGSWDMSSDKRRMMGCIECHDPHRPRLHNFVKPLPPPNTLRMGHQPRGLAPAGRNPLMPRLPKPKPKPETETETKTEAP